MIDLIIIISCLAIAILLIRKSLKNETEIHEVRKEKAKIIGKYRIARAENEKLREEIERMRREK